MSTFTHTGLLVFEVCRTASAPAASLTLGLAFILVSQCDANACGDALTISGASTSAPLTTQASLHDDVGRKRKCVRRDVEDACPTSSDYATQDSANTCYGGPDVLCHSTPDTGHAPCCSEALSASTAATSGISAPCNSEPHSSSIVDDKYIHGTRLLVNGWFQACRGCNEPTAHTAMMAAREVPVCPRCAATAAAAASRCPCNRMPQPMGALHGCFVLRTCRYPRTLTPSPYACCLQVPRQV